MNPLSMETMFMILSAVILAAGVLYWFWSHIQLTQKKVQLLENAVFELRGMVGSSSGPGSGPGPEPMGDSAMAPFAPPQEVYRDLEDDDWKDEEAPPPATVTVQPTLPEPVGIGREEPVPSASFKELFMTAEQPPAQNQTLEGLPLKELRRMASERGITGTSEMKKKDVIAALRNTVHPSLAPASDSVEVEKEMELSSLDVPELE
jgi:hypothetical protein